jgi:hypothetical protein
MIFSWLGELELCVRETLPPESWNGEVRKFVTYIISKGREHLFVGS